MTAKSCAALVIGIALLGLPFAASAQSAATDQPAVVLLTRLIQLLEQEVQMLLALHAQVAPAAADVPASSCVFNGHVIATGTGVLGYQSASVPVGQACIAQQLICNNGVLSGGASQYPYVSCTVATGASCMFNGTIIPNDTYVIGYQSQGVPSGQACVSHKMLCVNGTISNSAYYPYSSCSVQSSSSCTYNGQIIQNGASIIGYSSATVPSGQACVPVSLMCSNGSIANAAAYPFSSCSVASQTTASLTASPSSGVVPLSVTFSSPWGIPVNANGVQSVGEEYWIDFGDGSTQSLRCPASNVACSIPVTVTHTYEKLGSYTVAVDAAPVASNPITTTLGTVVITVQTEACPVGTVWQEVCPVSGSIPCAYGCYTTATGSGS